MYLAIVAIFASSLEVIPWMVTGECTAAPAVTQIASGLQIGAQDTWTILCAVWGTLEPWSPVLGEGQASGLHARRPVGLQGGPDAAWLR